MKDLSRHPARSSTNLPYPEKRNYEEDLGIARQGCLDLIAFLVADHGLESGVDWECVGGGCETCSISDRRDARAEPDGRREGFGREEEDALDGMGVQETRRALALALAGTEAREVVAAGPDQMIRLGVEIVARKLIGDGEG